MEIGDSEEAIEISDSPCIKRRPRRRSSLYGSPLLQNNVPDNSKLEYIAQLQNEKVQWHQLYQKTKEENIKLEPPMECNMNDLNTELREFCDKRPDMIKFAADTNTFMKKLEFYMKMENYYAKKVKYAEDKLKEKVDELATKLFVDEIEEKIYL